MITDASKAHGNLRIALHQIYVNLYVEYVVKNPLAPVEHGSHAAGGANNKDGGKDGRKGNGSGGGGGGGVKSELFELGIEKFLVSSFYFLSFCVLLKREGRGNGMGMIQFRCTRIEREVV